MPAHCRQSPSLCMNCISAEHPLEDRAHKNVSIKFSFVDRVEEEESSKTVGMAKIWLIFCIAMWASISLVHSIDDKCSACNAIAEELERGLMNEKPRNHLDLRNRLDSKGQRQGKVIDYRVSELRVVELLDGLCEKMQDYTLEKASYGTQVWIKVLNWDILKTNKQEAKAHSKDISSFCGRLLEETEDELSDLIKKGSVKVGDVNRVLCEDLSKYCQKSSSGYDDDKDAEGEL